MFSSLAAILPFRRYGEKLSDPISPPKAAFGETKYCRACGGVDFYRRYRVGILEIGVGEYMGNYIDDSLGD